MPKYQNRFIQKYGQDQLQFSRFQWQKSFRDHYIRDENDFDDHLEYIWSNPEKHKVVKNFKDYKYSSYINYQDLIDNFN